MSSLHVSLTDAGAESDAFEAWIELDGELWATVREVPGGEPLIEFPTVKRGALRERVSFQTIELRELENALHVARERLSA